MNNIGRRKFFSGAIMSVSLIGCSNNTITRSGSDIERDAEDAMDRLYKTNTYTRSIYNREAGV